jgi:hypothetical protein
VLGPRRALGHAGLAFLFAFLPRLSVMDQRNATPLAYGVFLECLGIALYAAQRRLMAEKATHQFHRARNCFPRGSAALRHFWVAKPINISTKCWSAGARANWADRMDTAPAKKWPDQPPGGAESSHHNSGSAPRFKGGSRRRPAPQVSLPQASPIRESPDQLADARTSNSQGKSPTTVAMPQWVQGGHFSRRESPR